MALFKVYRGLSSSLPEGLHDGYAYFTTDDGKIMKLYFSDMWLSKSPFCDNGDDDLYISMNVRL